MQDLTFGSGSDLEPSEKCRCSGLVVLRSGTRPGKSNWKRLRIFSENQDGTLAMALAVGTAFSGRQTEPVHEMGTTRLTVESIAPRSTVVLFVTCQIISNYGLIKLKRFISC